MASIHYEDSWFSFTPTIKRSSWGGVGGVGGEGWGERDAQRSPSTLSDELNTIMWTHPPSLPSSARSSDASTFPEQMSASFFAPWLWHIIKISFLVPELSEDPIHATLLILFLIFDLYCKTPECKEAPKLQLKVQVDLVKCQLAIY